MRALRSVSEEGGRLYSQELGLWFGWENERRTFVRIWTPDGRRLLTKEEEWQRAQEADQRTQEAERRAQAAEQRTQEAEARTAALALELERLRRAVPGPPKDAA